MLKDLEKRYIDFSVRILEDLRSRSPLVHIISNAVTIESVADMVLATGALPIAAHAPEEVGEVTSRADSLLLNTGTPDSQRFESYLISGKVAKEKGIPVTFDPVGAGISRFREKITKTILDKVCPRIVRMNQGEAAFIVKSDKKSLRGVDSLEINMEKHDLERFARENRVILVVTGRTNIVTDGKNTFETLLGNPVMKRVTGGGCMLDAIIASFAASSIGSILDRTVSALVLYNYLSTKLSGKGIKEELISSVRNFPE